MQILTDLDPQHCKYKPSLPPGSSAPGSVQTFERDDELVRREEVRHGAIQAQLHPLQRPEAHKY
jgi:hypothetical protein